MTPLSAFWHKTRKQYVPLTGREWDRKAGITSGDRSTLSRSGMVFSKPTPLRGGDQDNIYEITPAGIEAHRASLMGGAA